MDRFCGPVRSVQTFDGGTESWAEVQGGFRARGAEVSQVIQEQQFIDEWQLGSDFGEKLLKIVLVFWLAKLVTEDSTGDVFVGRSS